MQYFGRMYGTSPGQYSERLILTLQTSLVTFGSVVFRDRLVIVTTRGEKTVDISIQALRQKFVMMCICSHITSTGSTRFVHARSIFLCLASAVDVISAVIKDGATANADEEND